MSLPSRLIVEHADQYCPSIGSFYAFVLDRTKRVRLTVVARSNYDAVKQNVGRVHEVKELLADEATGRDCTSKARTMETMLFIQQKVRSFPLSVSARSEADQLRVVVRTPAEAVETYDYIVCTNKAINQASVAKQLAPAVDESNTCFVIIQNGVGNEEPFREEYPKSVILSCVVSEASGLGISATDAIETWVGANQNTPGVVNHWKSENTEIGIFGNPTIDHATEQAKLDEFTSLLREGKTPFSVEENVQIKRWSKVVWNCAWNSLTALTMLDTHSWLKSSPDSTPMTRTLMQEVINVASACDVPMKDELIDELMDKILAMQPIGSSMQTDCKMGKPMEVEIILGTPVRKGRELGVPTPVLEVLYTLLMAINTRMKPT